MAWPWIVCGNFYVTICCGDNNEIRKFDPQGKLLATYGSFSGR